jgi:hypothetical protein
MSDLDVARLRTHWHRGSSTRGALPVQHADQNPCVVENDRGDAVSLVDELRRLVDGDCGQRHPILSKLLSEARACCVVLSSRTGAAAAPAATRLLELVEQIEDLLEVYDGLGLAR